MPTARKRKASKAPRKGGKRTRSRMSTPATKPAMADMTPATPATMADIPDPVSLAEAVAISGLSERTLRRRMRAGKLGHKRQGRLCLLSRSEVEGLSGGASQTPATTPVNGGQMADITPATADTQALAPMLADELAALRRQNEGLHGLVVDLNRRLDDQRQLLTAGDVEHHQDLAELRERVGRAETARRWALIVAGVLGAGVVALAVALAVMLPS